MSRFREILEETRYRIRHDTSDKVKAALGAGGYSGLDIKRARQVGITKGGSKIHHVTFNEPDETITDRSGHYPEFDIGKKKKTRVTGTPLTRGNVHVDKKGRGDF